MIISNSAIFVGVSPPTFYKKELRKQRKHEYDTESHDGMYMHYLSATVQYNFNIDISTDSDLFVSDSDTSLMGFHDFEFSSSGMYTYMYRIYLH